MGMSNISAQKYRKANIIYWSINAFLILVSLFGFYNISPNKITTFIPFQNQYFEFVTIFISIPFSAIIGALIGGYLLSPVFLFIHKLLNPKMVYFVEESVDTGKFDQIFQGFYPALLAFNLNSMIIQVYPSAVKSILDPRFQDAPFMILYSFGSIVLLMFTIGVSMIVFSPAFFLNDGCILYSSEELVEETGRPIETRTVGGWFYGYFKGYAGLSVAFSYFLIIFNYISNVRMEYVFILFWFGLPFFITVSVIPCFTFLDRIREHRMKYIQRIAVLMGID
jgi:hypothetical protein